MSDIVDRVDDLDGEDVHDGSANGNGSSQDTGNMRLHRAAAPAEGHREEEEEENNRLEPAEADLPTITVVSSGVGAVVTVLPTPTLADLPVLERARQGWLHQARTQSAKTARAYTDTLASFETALRQEALTLDARAVDQVGAVAQVWAVRPRPDGNSVAPTTINQRLAILSSFYTYAGRVCEDAGQPPLANPISRVTRRRVQAYGSARALDREHVTQGLSQIPAETPEGLRDYALLTLAVTTGRRVAELAALTLGDLELRRGTITVTWRHTKGGKILYDTLDPLVSAALLHWLALLYDPDNGRCRTERVLPTRRGSALATQFQAIGGLEVLGRLVDGWDSLPAALPAAGPVWVALSHNASYGHPLGVQAIADLCQKWLGTTRVHRLRHTFAHGMQAVGAPMPTIQARLGHESLATTGRYLQQLTSAENPHAAALVDHFGLRRRRRTPTSDN